MIQYFSAKHRNSVNGFTLIELLVVIAVIGLLASVVLVSLGGSREKARDSKGETELKQITNAFEMKYTSDGEYPGLPVSIEDITVNDTTTLSPYLSPVPYSNGKINYQWYNEGDIQKFCVIFEYENRPGYFTCSHAGCYAIDPDPSDPVACPDF